jgi:hypothetical protein
MILITELLFAKISRKYSKKIAGRIYLIKTIYYLCFDFDNMTSTKMEENLYEAFYISDLHYRFVLIFINSYSISI